MGDREGRGWDGRYRIGRCHGPDDSTHQSQWPLYASGGDVRGHGALSEKRRGARGAAGGRQWEFTSWATTGGPRGANSFTISRAGAEIMSWNSGDAWYAYFANIGSMRVLQAGAVDSAGTGNRAVYVLN